MSSFYMSGIGSGRSGCDLSGHILNGDLPRTKEQITEVVRVVKSDLGLENFVPLFIWPLDD